MNPIPEKFLDSLGMNFNPDFAQLGFAIVVATQALMQQPGFDRKRFLESIDAVCVEVDPRRQTLLWSVLDALRSA